MVLNSGCCGSFTRQGIHYKHLPISNIIMSVKTWKTVMTPYNTDPKKASDIIEYITDDLGRSRSSKLHVGRADDIIWNADQFINSMQIAEFETRFSKDYVKYQPHWRSLHRLDRDLKLYKYHFSKDVHLPCDFISFKH